MAIVKFEEYCRINENAIVENPLKEMFDEYETTNLSVEDLEYTFQGVLITNICDTPEGLQFWSGDPETDKHAEQILLDEVSKDELITRVLEYM